MKKRFLIVLFTVVLLIGSLPASVFAEQSDDIIILYENDVHCKIEG